MLGAPFIPGLGFEPKVVGYVYNAGFAANTVSPGIKSQSAVYFVTVLGKTSKQLDPGAVQNMMMQIRGNEESQTRNYLTQMLQQTISKTADIKYNITNF